jgi:putative FmdB family regulatory protein
MPIYVYQCADCDTQIEKRQGFADAPLTTCERCGGSVRRVLQPVGIIFKGSGFYSTDSRSASTNGKKDGAAGEAKPASGTESGGESSGESGGETKNGSGEKAAASTTTNGTTSAPATKSTSSASTKSSDTNS